MERHGIRLGSTISAVAGLAFVVVNGRSVSASTPVPVLGALLFLAVLVAVARSRAESPPPSRTAIRTYGFCVLAEVLAILAGARVLNALDQPDLVLCWVVLIVGLHFVPFASAFHAPVFTGIGLALGLVGLVGGAAVLAGVDDAQRWCGVAAGFVLLLGGGYGVLRPARAL